MAQPKSRTPLTARPDAGERLEILDAAFDGLRHGEIIELLSQWDFELVEKMGRPISSGSPKGSLQTYCARRKLAAPTYITRQDGSRSKPIFYATAHIVLANGMPQASQECAGPRKIMAEENAAQDLYRRLMEDGGDHD